MKLIIILVFMLTISLSPQIKTEDFTYDYYEGVKLAKESNKPMLLFFTGLKCKYPMQANELVENDDEIRAKLKELYVPVILYVDDREKLSKEKTVERNGIKIKLRTKGNEWAHIEKSKYNNNIQPLMVVVNANEEIIKAPIFGKLSKDKILQYIEN